ncbi:hypothetical protein [Streptomyces fagopyri]|uniref:hypothetical protein n=1 Tax=Streptomyces fagopyri TaxID=2662397 RepID=UPI0033D88AB3
MPDQPLHTALVTRSAALLSDCSTSWRVPVDGEPLVMTGEPLVPDPDPQFAIFPLSMRDYAAELRKYYAEPLFPYDTSASIARSMLEGAAPVAVHFTEHVLNSAVVRAAIGHGMFVRLQKTNTLLEKPYQATEYIFQALMARSSSARTWSSHARRGTRNARAASSPGFCTRTMPTRWHRWTTSTTTATCRCRNPVPSPGPRSPSRAPAASSRTAQ